MKHYDKLIFVCKSNTSVSPMAEAIMQHTFMLEDILIESRGLVVLFPEPVNPKSEAIMASHGLTMKNHTSRALTADDFDERTLILAMDDGLRQSILDDFKEALNVWSLPEYIGSTQELTDPYGGTLADYGRCYEQLKEMTDRLAAQLKKEDMPEPGASLKKEPEEAGEPETDEMPDPEAPAQD